MYFETDQVAQMNDTINHLAGKCRELREKMVDRKYSSPRAEEHAKQGFCRRFGLMIRSTYNVFELLPPELERVPEDDVAIDATINIQSFVTNVVGCCDNLAWI